MSLLGYLRGCGAHLEGKLGGFGDLVGACEVIEMVKRVYNPLDILDDR